MIVERKRASDAIKIFLEKISHRVEAEIVEVNDALNRVLAEDVYSSCDIPPFDRAAMDGYAVRAEDTFFADEENPAILKVVGEVETGEKPEVEVGRGEAVRISTGAMMPPNANAVVMVEYTSENESGYVEVYRGVAPGENVSAKGEDMKKGELVLKKGSVVQAYDVGLLLASGAERVSVARKVRVAVASTGDEVVDASEVYKGGGKTGKCLENTGKILDTNRPVILSFLKNFCEVVDLGVVRDSKEEMRKAFEKATSFDMAIFTGATSAGKKDVMPEILEEYGELLVHGVAIKPGMPTALGVVDGKPVVLLPGSPVACFISLKLFALPAIWILQGTEVLACPGEVIKARLERRIPSNAGTRTFARVRLRREKDGYVAVPVRTSGSGIMSSIVRAHGVVEVEEGVEGIESGEIVEVRLIRHLVKSDLMG